jgi:hypothetical protein
MTDSPDDWARNKTDDLLRKFLDDASSNNNDSGLDDTVIGQLYNGVIRVDGFELALPPGSWAKLARAEINTPTATGVAYFLGKIQLKRLVGAVRVFAMKSKDKLGVGVGLLKGCEKDNPNNFFTYHEDSISLDKQACWLIHNYYTTPWQQWADQAVNISDLDRLAARDMASKDITYPQDFVGVRFSCAEEWGFLEVTYLFSPEAEGVSSSTVLSYREADWHPKNIAHFPEKLTYMAKLKDWGTSFWPKFQAAFAKAK